MVRVLRTAGVRSGRTVDVGFPKEPNSLFGVCQENSASLDDLTAMFASWAACKLFTRAPAVNHLAAIQGACADVGEQPCFVVAECAPTNKIGTDGLVRNRFAFAE